MRGKRLSGNYFLYILPLSFEGDRPPNEKPNGVWVKGEIKMSEHLINVFLGLSIIVLPIINIYYLAKISTIFDESDKDDFKEGS